jgi:hypothetical protein
MIDRNDSRQIAEAPDRTEEAAKHPVPDGKFIKVACVHKSVPRIIE